MMNDVDTLMLFDDADLRMDRLLYIPAMLREPPEAARGLTEFLEDEDDGTLKKCFPLLPDKFFELRADDFDEAFEFFYDWVRTGVDVRFVAEFMTPVWKNRNGTVSGSFSHCHLVWLSAGTIEDLTALGLKWAQERFAAALGTAADA